MLMILRVLLYIHHMLASLLLLFILHIALLIFITLLF